MKEGVIKGVLDRILEGNSARCWQIIREEINNLKEFNVKFKEIFCGEETQQGIRSRIEVEKYRSGEVDIKNRLFFGEGNTINIKKLNCKNDS